MEEKDIVNTTAEELSSANLTTKRKSLLLSEATHPLHRLKTSCLIIMKMILPLHLTA